MALTAEEVERIRNQLLTGIRPKVFVATAAPTEQVAATVEPMVTQEFSAFDESAINQIVNLYRDAILSLDFTIGRTLAPTWAKFNNDPEALRASDDPAAKRIVAEADGPIGDLLGLRAFVTTYFNTQPFRYTRRLVVEDLVDAERQLVEAYLLDALRPELGDETVNGATAELKSFAFGDLAEIAQLAHLLAGPEDKRLILAMDPRFALPTFPGDGDAVTGASNRLGLAQAAVELRSIDTLKAHGTPLLMFFPSADGTKIIERLLKLFAKGGGSKAVLEEVKAGEKMLLANSPVIRGIADEVILATGAKVPINVEGKISPLMKAAQARIQETVGTDAFSKYVNIMVKDLVASSGKPAEQAVMGRAELEYAIMIGFDALGTKTANPAFTEKFLAALAQAGRVRTSAVKGNVVRKPGVSSRIAGTVDDAVAAAPPADQQPAVIRGVRSANGAASGQQASNIPNQSGNDVLRGTSATRAAEGVTPQLEDKLPSVFVKNGAVDAALQRLNKFLQEIGEKPLLDFDERINAPAIARELEAAMTPETADLIRQLTRFNVFSLEFDRAFNSRALEDSRTALTKMLAELELFKANLDKARLPDLSRRVLGEQAVVMTNKTVEGSRRVGVVRSFIDLGERAAAFMEANAVAPLGMENIAARFLLEESREILAQIEAKNIALTDEMRELARIIDQFNTTIIEFDKTGTSKFADIAALEEIQKRLDTIGALYRGKFGTFGPTLPTFARDVFEGQVGAMKQTTTELFKQIESFRKARGIARAGIIARALRVRFPSFFKGSRLKLGYGFWGNAAQVVTSPLAAASGSGLLVLFIAQQTSEFLIWGPGFLGDMLRKDVYGEATAVKLTNSAYYEVVKAHKLLTSQVFSDVAAAKETRKTLGANVELLKKTVEDGKTGVLGALTFGVVNAGGFTDAGLEMANGQLQNSGGLLADADRLIREAESRGIGGFKPRIVDAVYDPLIDQVRALLITANDSFKVKDFIGAAAQTLAALAVVNELQARIDMDQKALGDFWAESMRRWTENFLIQIDALLFKIEIDELAGLNGTKRRELLKGKPRDRQIERLKAFGVTEEQIKQLRTAEQAAEKLAEEFRKDIEKKNAGPKSVIPR